MNDGEGNKRRKKKKIAKKQHATEREIYNNHKNNRQRNSTDIRDRAKRKKQRHITAQQEIQ